VLKVRVIPTLLHKDFGLVKGVGFNARRAVGSPVQAVKVYELRGVDELVFLDVAATPNGRPPDLELVDELADECFMPLTVGGGVGSVDDVARLLEVGADKVCIGTAAIESPQLVERAAARFGSQCIVASIDTKRAGEALSVTTHCGTRPRADGLEQVVRRLTEAGAGELLVQSVDRDGTMSGYDLDVLARVALSTSLPVIASGGAGSYADMVDAMGVPGVGAVAAASIFHFTELTPMGAKDALRAAGFPVRR
jgi:cyclase